LYRGFSISLVSIPVFNTIYFPIYELFKSRLKQRFQWQENEIKLYSSSAALAGTMSNFITNPLWVVRTRMQSEIFDNGCQEHFNRKYNHGVFSIYKNIYTLAKTEGVRALYKGFSATMLGILHPIIFFPTYEKLKIYFKQNYDRDS
jgi:solute carrier family 25 (mitochondrial folate transporter), member 32